MKRRVLLRNCMGTTLSEIMVAMTVFAILIAVMYPTFSFLRAQNNYISDMEALNSKGQRVLNYLADDLKLAGMLLGPGARIPYCTDGAVPDIPNAVLHTAGNPYDTITFLTSVPVTVSATGSCVTEQKGCNGAQRQDYALTTVCDALPGAATIGVDAAWSCYSQHITAASGADNGKSLITFESLAPLEAGLAGNAPQVYYTVTGARSGISVTPPLNFAVPDNHTVYAVRQYRYRVDTSDHRRDLIREGWNEACTTAGTQSELVETCTTSRDSGGIDGLRFEFLYEDAASKTLVTRPSLPVTSTEWANWKLSQLKAIKIWLLLRSDAPDRNYINDEAYGLGEESRILRGPFNDGFRRLLLTKTVEVRNRAIRSE